LSTAEPIIILMYPRRTEVIFAERQQVVSKKTRTVEGALSRARGAAQKLRDLGARVSVFPEDRHGRKRVLVEVRLPLPDGSLEPKTTRFFKSEKEAIAYLRQTTEENVCPAGATQAARGGSA
jgi:hypothetical protein